MKLAVQEDACIEVLLRRVAKILVFSEDLLEELPDVVEVFIRGVFVAVHLILHLGLGGRGRDAAHDVEEDGAMGRVSGWSCLGTGLGHSRDCDGGVRIVEGAVDSQALLLGLVDVEVLDVAAVGLDPVL